MRPKASVAWNRWPELPKRSLSLGLRPVPQLCCSVSMNFAIKAPTVSDWRGKVRSSGSDSAS